MKKIVFLSDMAFDANVSMVKHLSRFYDIFFLSICRAGVENRIGKIDLTDEITCAEKIKEFGILKAFLNLEKTFLVKHYSKKEMGWKCFFKKFVVDLKVLFFLNRIKPSAVMVDSLNFPITRLFYRMKIVNLVHDPFPHRGEHNFYRRLSDISMKCLSSRYVLFNENQKKDFIAKYHIDSKRVYSAFLGVYEILELFDDNCVDESLKHNVFFWGRVSPYKGIEYLVEGFKQFLKETGDSNATLIIAGEGKYHFDIHRAVEGVSQITVIERFLTMREMVHYLKNSFIAVCPYTDATQSGVVMSAFAMKKTILATKVGGLPEMLDDGNVGMLIPPCDSDAICQSIKSLFANTDKVKSYETAIEKLYFGNGKKSWSNGVKGIVDAIESL
ncbi:glycosyltransferase family 4 protein [Candidatus Saccharibacteria bacterium]|nr:glycosyltransferase family 4 protein [Candidatus Saccharibacteria bacterium]